MNECERFGYKADVNSYEIDAIELNKIISIEYYNHYYYNNNS